MLSKLQIAVAVTGEMCSESDEGVISFVDADGVTTPIPQATLDEIETQYAAQSGDNDPAITGNQKLLDLGLTQAEATALTGYAPN